MRKIPIIILSVLLAAAVVSVIMLYRQGQETKDALLISEKKA